MRYCRHIYIGEGLEKKKKKIIDKLERGKIQKKLYVLVLPECGMNQLEIYDAAQFLQPSFPNDNFFVVGIVKDYEEALNYVEELAAKVYNECQGTDIRSYILKREQEE